MTLHDLAARCESAAEAEQRELLDEAWDAVAPMFPRDLLADRAARFGRMFDAEAYESAALMLVPEGWAWMAGCAAGETFFATLSPTDESGIEADMIDTNAATPALALCAAALRARAQIEGGTDNDQ